MRNALLPALLLPALLIAACDSSSPDPSSGADPLFPLAVGNAWVMETTNTILAGEPSVRIDTIFVTRDTLVGDETWFEIYNRFGFGFVGVRNGTNWYMLREDGLWRLDDDRQAVKLLDYPTTVGNTTRPRAGVSYTRVAEDSVFSVEGIGTIRTIPYAVRVYNGYDITDSMGNTFVLEGDTTFVDYFSPEFGFVETGGFFARVDFQNGKLVPIGSQVRRLVEFLPDFLDRPLEATSSLQVPEPGKHDSAPRLIHGPRAW